MLVGTFFSGLLTQQYHAPPRERLPLNLLHHPDVFYISDGDSTQELKAMETAQQQFKNTQTSHHNQFKIIVKKKEMFMGWLLSSGNWISGHGRPEALFAQQFSLFLYVIG